MHFASANHSQGRELFQPIELQYSVLATWWKYREPSVKIHYWSFSSVRRRYDPVRSTGLSHNRFAAPPESGREMLPRVVCIQSSAITTPYSFLPRSHSL